MALARKLLRQNDRLDCYNLEDIDYTLYNAYTMQKKINQTQNSSSTCIKDAHFNIEIAIMFALPTQDCNTQ